MGAPGVVLHGVWSTLRVAGRLATGGDCASWAGGFQVRTASSGEVWRRAVADKVRSYMACVDILG